VRFPGRQLVLDTNILVYWLRGLEAGEGLRALYDLGHRSPRPIVPVVVKGEIISLALKFGWGTARQAAIATLLRQLPIADISHDTVIEEYARIDHLSTAGGRKMSKNDLWIAAVACLQHAVILTADHDFDHLHPDIEVERVDVAELQAVGRSNKPAG
jgi:tRNA(fMet)-specific endonuclease VapC